MRKYLCLLALLLASGQTTLAFDPADALEAVIEHVSQYHFAPPTRQEMVLAFLRDIDPSQPAAELSVQISDLGGKEQLYAFLRQRLADKPTEAATFCMELDKHVETNRVIPGGFSIDPSKDIAVNQQLAANRYVGIGVQSTMMDGKFIFQKIVEGGPAEVAGILAQDVLLEVDGQKVAGIALGDIIQLLRGPENSTVSVVVQTGESAPRALEMTRTVVRMKSVFKDETQRKTLASFRIESLTASTVSELEELLDQLPDKVVAIELTMPRNDDLHLNHLLFDALADEVTLGALIGRNGRSLIQTQAGTILGSRRVAYLVAGYQPPTNLTVQFASQAKLKWRDPSEVHWQEPTGDHVSYCYDSFPLGDDSHSVRIATRHVVAIAIPAASGAE